MRTKLISDIHNRLGLKSVSSTYVQLYINDEFMGLYIFNDDYKLSWIEEVYGEKNTKNLYKCDYMYDLLPEYSFGCSNENEEEINNNSEWIEFLTAVKNAKSATDLEDIFEIDHFLYEMAIDYLTGAYDHIQNTHNYYMYKQPNGKWIYLSYDFDHDFGQDMGFLRSSITNTIRDIHLMEVLIFNDSSGFEKILSEVVSKVFNPAILYPYIDEIKKYIKPYVILDKIKDTNGNYPGSINSNSDYDHFTLEQWDAYSEFTNGYSDRESYGLKYWILIKYRYVCDYYHLECDSTYLDENFQYSIKNIIINNDDDDDDIKQYNDYKSDTIISDEVQSESTQSDLLDTLDDDIPIEIDESIVIEDESDSDNDDDDDNDEYSVVNIISNEYHKNYY
ncbi:hypothetical protein BCR36DRAFT_362037 [Piromyces finnis]|uniref:Coth-domain-containing protein n=1 Tax=Piromyces finnis TaxID=1754191 RepID=A0A1Y1UZ99_9FUNG|nr:hypothetical protein BCR36DRAFT_362037 [Piromyces finnis]|eukprot:ORX42696.1 hypothetical protein BCR36DRAFT_362037 [Piromyces finnis]